jgi:beta-N-acetylhexosaminidase
MRSISGVRGSRRKHRCMPAWRQRTRILPACLAALAIACSGCSGPAGSAPAGPKPQPTRTTPSSPAGSASAARSSPRSAARPSCAARVFSRMTEAQRVGQLFMVGLAGDESGPALAHAVSTYHFGSVLFGTNSTAGLAGTRLVTSAVQSLASAQATANVRFFIAANQEGGNIQALRGPGFPAIPSALAQGQLSPAALRQEAAAWGSELRSAGVNLNLAPVMDVVTPGTDSRNQPIGMLQREFGHDPATVAAHGVAFIHGMEQAGVATTAKHFPGLGRVYGNTDFTSGVVDTTTTPGDPYLQPYQAAIGAGVPFVMAALATYTRIDPHHLAVFSPRVMGTMLRQQLRFQGVIVSDDMGVAVAVAGIPPAARAIDFLAAGGDLITSETVTAATAMDGAVLRQAAADPAFRAQVSSAVLRVLAAKQAYGLLPCTAT